MTLGSNSQKHEKALKMAETGNHEKALVLIKEYLMERPDDGQAWNDSGAIHYCLNDVETAIKHFLRAKDICGNGQDAAEIYWNLTEAYLTADDPKAVLGLLDDLERLELVNPDLYNRLANSFLMQEDLANAIEILYKSIEMAEGQEILMPMIEVIRSKRGRVSFFADHETQALKDIYRFVSSRFNTECHVGRTVSEIREIASQSDILWFEGCSEGFCEFSQTPTDKHTIVRLNSTDIDVSYFSEIDFSAVDTLIIPATSAFEQSFNQKVGKISGATKVIRLQPAVNIDSCEFVNKSKGKRLACVGNFNAMNNLQLVLQAMQKLNFIDSDFRLYLAGTFENTAVRRYVNHIIDSMGLANVVFFDGHQEDMNAWMRDKHYIVSSDLSGAGVETILAAMARGLKPVVHNFPDAKNIFGHDYVFDISEQFCEQVLSDNYQSSQYRHIAESGYDVKAQFNKINNLLCQYERMAQAKQRLDSKRQAAETVQQPVIQPVETQPVEQIPVINQQPSVPQVLEPSIAEPPVEEKPKVIPIKPIDPFEFKTEPQPQQQPEPKEAVMPSSAPLKQPDTSQGRISRVAAAAIEASKTLTDLARKQRNPKQDPAEWEDIKGYRSGQTSLEDSFRDKEVTKAAQEFSGIEVTPVELREEKDQTAFFTT